MMKRIFTLLLVSNLFSAIAYAEFSNSKDQAELTAVQNFYGPIEIEAMRSQDKALREQARQNSGDAISASQGFLDVAVTPAVIQKAAASVFLIVGLGVNDASSDAMYALSDIESYLSGDASELSSEEAQNREIVRYYYQQCVDQGQASCFIPNQVDGRSMNQATAFLIGRSGTRLLTARHFFKAFLKSPVKRIDLFLFNSKNQLVSTPTQNGMVRELKDQVEDGSEILNVTSSLGVGLKIADALPRVGSKSYNIGFPSCTGCLTTYTNSRGEDLWGTMGTRFPYADAVGSTQNVTVGEFVFNPYGNEILSNADGAPGMSGGPTLNEAGEVIGIIIGTQAQSVNIGYPAGNHLLFSTSLL